MSMGRAKSLVLKRPDQLAALASPLRIEILEHLGASGPCSIAQLARRMDRPPDALYYHVHKLLRAGVVQAHGTRKSARRDEAVYGVAAERIAGGMNPSAPAAAEAVIKSAEVVLRMTSREFKAAIPQLSATDCGELRRIHGRRHKAWLSDEGLARLHRYIDAIERLLIRENKRVRGRQYALTLFLVPLVKKGRSFR